MYMQVAWRLELTAPGLAQQVALQVVGEPGLFNAGNTKGSADYAPAVQTVLAGKTTLCS